LLSDRNAIFNAAAPSRHSRILIPLADDGLLLWESLRRCPEGLTAALVSSEAARDALFRYSAALDQPDQPEIAALETLPSPEQAAEWFSSPVFDFILIRESKRKSFTAGDEAAFSRLASSAKPLLADGGSLVLLCSPPSLGERISRIIAECGNGPLAEKVRKAEDSFFSLKDFWNWDAAVLSDAFQSQCFEVKIETLEQTEERLVGSKDIDVWFNRENSRWGTFMGKTLDGEDFTETENTLRQRIQEGPLIWKWKSLLVTAKILFPN
jgi:putative ATPase